MVETGMQAMEIVRLLAGDQSCVWLSSEVLGAAAAGACQVLAWMPRE